MHLLQRVARKVEVLLGSDDVNFLSVIESLADERNVLQAKKRDVPASYLAWAAQCELSLPVEGTLPKDRAKQTTVRQQGFYIVQYLNFCMRG